MLLPLSLCLSVHRITQEVVDKFLTKFQSSISYKFCDGMSDVSLTKKKHSILMQILIAEFIAEVLPLQDKSSCKNFMSSSVDEHNV